MSTEEDVYQKPEDNNTNIDLWKSVEQTPASQVKPAKLNGVACKSVKPHYQRMRATEMFGPFGEGWGVIPESVKFERTQIGDTHLLHYTATMFYIFKGKRGEFPICSTEKEAYVTSAGKGYLKIDDTADKKVATNALTKGLSFLGFSADVFHGLYDDINYVNHMQSEEIGEKEIKQIDEKHEYQEWRSKALSELALCDTVASLEKLYFSVLRKMNEKGDSKAVVKAEEVKTARLNKLMEKK